MDAPALVFVPSTPLKFDLPTPQHPPPPAPSIQRPISNLPPARFSVADSGRTSSETAIFSIYSMYGEDPQSTRTASDSPNSKFDRKSKDAIPTLNLPISDGDDLSSSANRFSSAVPYRDDGKVPIHQVAGLAISYEQPVSSVLPPNGDVHDSCPPSRPESGYATMSSLRATSESRNGHSGHHPRSSDFTASSRTSGTSMMGQSFSRVSQLSGNSYSSSPRSHNRQSSLSAREYPPLPPSAPTTPSPTPPRHPSPILLTPKANKNTRAATPASSPASMVSLVPSEGEDMDAFHVRNTYAQLEASGVKGDGYEEGIERTRARVGISRTSQLQAAAALGDGKQKQRELDPKEIQLLSSVDRYGFFTIPSHDRLIKLSTAPLLKKLSRTSAGPASASSNAVSLPALPPPALPLKEASRIAKWTKMLQPLSRDHGGNVESWSVNPKRSSKLRERTYKGVPDRWRAAAWDFFMTRYSKMSSRELSALAREYREALDKPSTYDIQIDLDVPRTIGGHIMFRTRYGAGQRSLFHVLHSFSLRCSTCGYVQGMGPIAATLLCYFDPERVYSSLVRLHDAYDMHTVFNPGFPGLLEAIYVQERITEQMMPDVYAAFKKHMISTTSYATKWYITLFANSVPFQTQLRLWDAFLLDGYDVFIAVAVAIVWVYRDHITSNSANFETVLSLLSSFFVPEDENVLLSWIEQTLGDKKLRSSMTKWRQDWKELVASGKDGAALL